eukprot:3503389-Prymnesium_polylepis.1
MGGACGGDPERTGICVRVRLQGHLVALRIPLRAREDARATMEMARRGAGSAVGAEPGVGKAACGHLEQAMGDDGVNT